MIEEPAWQPFSDDLLAPTDARCAICRAVWPQQDMEQVGLDEPKNVQYICPVCLEEEGDRC